MIYLIRFQLVGVLLLLCFSLYGWSTEKTSAFSYEMSFDIDGKINQGGYSYYKNKLHCEAGELDFDLILDFAMELETTDIRLLFDCVDEESRKMSFYSNIGIDYGSKFVFKISKINIPGSLRICAVSRFLLLRDDKIVHELECLNKGFHFQMSDGAETYVTVHKGNGRKTIIQKIRAEIELLNIRDGDSCINR